MKTTILSMLVVAVVFLTSCNKDYECHCTYMLDGVEFTPNPEEYTKVSSTEANENCDSRENMLKSEFPDAYEVSCGVSEK